MILLSKGLFRETQDNILGDGGIRIGELLPPEVMAEDIFIAAFRVGERRKRKLRFVGEGRSTGVWKETVGLEVDKLGVDRRAGEIGMGERATEDIEEMKGQKFLNIGWPVPLNMQHRGWWCWAPLWCVGSIKRTMGFLRNRESKNGQCKCVAKDQRGS